jgi:hypothetical protein
MLAQKPIQPVVQSVPGSQPLPDFGALKAQTMNARPPDIAMTGQEAVRPQFNPFQQEMAQRQAQQMEAVKQQQTANAMPLNRPSMLRTR